MTFSIQLLPARQGDAIIVRWADKQLVVDMGTTGVGKKLREQLSGHYELLVVTHIDSDHIGGVLSCLVDEPAPHITFGDVWFNGLDHAKTEAQRAFEEQGGVQGVALGRWLAAQPKWNDAFGGAPVVRDGAPRTFDIAGLEVTVLGPTRQRLAELAPVWQKELEAALKREAERQVVPEGYEAQGSRKKQVRPVLASASDLRAYADGVTGKDPSKANGSSIVLLLEHEGRKVLLGGDAYAGDLLAGIRSLGAERLALDAFKLPHHGSRENTTRALIAAVDCPLFLFSTDGTQFEHPHNEAVACVIECATTRPVRLGFNYQSKFTEWWNNDAWRAAHGYEVVYGDDDGLTIAF